jgi:tRNA wybutosine-synthesizing protein 2
LSRATPKRARLAAIVGKKDADSALKSIISTGAFDKNRKILKKEGMVEIPVISSVPGYEMVFQEHPAYYRSMPDLCSALQGRVPPQLLPLLPRGWFILGEVVVVKIHDQLKPYEALIGQALLEFYPRCCTVLADEGIRGPFREPVRRAIAGSRTRTVHKENGVVFHLDAGQVMFSPGNLKERMRMSRMGRNEYVVDMFAGIGYFTLPMAVHSRPRKILAIELNPNAYYYLCENVRQNQVEDIVQPLLGDCARVTPRGVADRVVMGMVQVTDQYLANGICSLKPGGILHYHQTTASWRYPDAVVQEVKGAAEGLGLRAEILNCQRVKKYSPGVVHAVIDARIDA